MKTNQIPCVTLEAMSQAFLKFWITLHVMAHNPPEIFQLKQYMTWTKRVQLQ